MSTTPALRRPARGTRLGRYRLCLELATGGMASVYLARVGGEAGFEKLVALKVIHPHLATDAAFVEMFLDEARIASRLDHANVCQVFDLGRDDDTYYLAMEYLAGESLARILRAERHEISVARRCALIARILADACEGLHAAHELEDAADRSLEVVHRDISPHNLFVTFDGVCKVLDFGIARARGRLHATSTGTIKGKFAYMSPEQLRGEAIDRRSDVWAMGVVLFECLTTRRLFRRESDGATSIAVLSAEIPVPSRLDAGIPPGLDAVVLKALARDPETRYATARELGRALLPFAMLDAAPVGLYDVATWMDGIFPGGRRERSTLEAVALQMEEDVIAGLASTAAGKSTAPVDHAAPEMAPRAGGRRTWVVGALLGVTGAVGLFLGLEHGRPIEPGDDAPLAAGRAAAAPPVASPPSAPRRDEGEGPPEPALPAAAPASQPAADPMPVEPAPARAARPSRRARGTVDVATPGGWASVQLGARTLGNTPLRVELEAGTHTLRIHPFGRTEAQPVRVTVRAGEVARVRHPVHH